ncbi:uncharacterized protein LOC135339960 isoform X2 [Halichondria panicea]|uniref:uncharacterized protein LOC135339960 isoform X2 n=2 Tax=Halichondria panicea TaxID=6063 RepID=UPI00312B65BE
MICDTMAFQKCMCVCLAVVLVVCSIVAASKPALKDDFPFRNVSLQIPERVKDLVDRLTLDEMVLQMSRGGASKNGPAPAISRLGINPYQWGTECLSGDVDAGPATSFPMAIGMAATFNFDIVHAVASAIGDEVRAKNNKYVSDGNYGFHTGLSCWSPVLNILRDPRWGRNQETYGEDPYLSGYLARAYVTGLQGDDERYVKANAGCKHFDVYGGPENIPISRFDFNAKVSEQDWRMTFLPPFKACVDAGAWSLMCSYNSINGVPACANKKLLTDILRMEWGFKGYVVSDQGAIEIMITNHHYTNNSVDTAAAAVNAGTCLEDANSADNVFSHIGEAVTQNKISMDTVKDAVSRLFTVRMKLGEFDPPEMNKYTKLNQSDFIQSKEHIQLAHDMAVQSFVLLKNNMDTGLPLTKQYNLACIVGPMINNTNGFYGDYSPIPDHVVTPLMGIRDLTKAVKQISANVGCTDGPTCNYYNGSSVKNACREADIAFVCLGNGGKVIGHEGSDRSNIDFPGQQLNILKDATMSVNGPTILLMYNAGPVDLTWADASDKVVSILENFYPAQTAGSALADVLNGVVSPGGRLPYTWPVSLDQVPPIVDYTMVNRTYRYFQSEPLYPFGYGLSYSTFKYSGLTVSPSSVKAGGNVTVSLQVTNTGAKYTADEVIQVYISWPNGVAVAPIRQLVGVARKTIKPGVTFSVSFTISGYQMQLYDSKWFIPTGRMTVYAGGQQPNQTRVTTSNVLQALFTVI